MHSKKLSKMVLGMALSLVMASGTVLASFAATTNDNTTTKGTISFKADKQEPGDPDDPTKPITPDPDEPGGGETTGALRILYVPNLKFGEHENAATGDYYAKPMKAKVENKDVIRPLSIQVGDSRSDAELDGWKLQVSQNAMGFEDNSDPQDPKQLTGTTIAFGDVKAELNNATGVNKNYTGADLTKDGFTIEPGQTKKVMTGKTGLGRGTFMNVYGAIDSKNGNEANNYNYKGVKLTIGDTPSKGSYETTLTWTITNTPN
ncbi:MAG: WxL domain-containing protein [Clostridioides sp.]|jgi:hypothetical protein|nr:WxL domain-containing protein [Clostridioides sp.]